MALRLSGLLERAAERCGSQITPKLSGDRIEYIGVPGQASHQEGALDAGRDLHGDLARKLVANLELPALHALTAPSPFFTYEPPNELISVFPLVLVPAYLVTLSVLLHLTSLAKLRRGVAHRSKITTAPA
jgi:hypothetical protein